MVNVVGKIVKSGLNKGRVKYKCPFCKKNHFHGLAEGEKSPIHRGSHCPISSEQVLIHL